MKLKDGQNALKSLIPIFRILSFSNLPITQPKVVSFLINFAPISQTLRVFEPNFRFPRRLEKSGFLGTFFKFSISKCISLKIGTRLMNLKDYELIAFEGRLSWFS